MLLSFNATFGSNEEKILQTQTFWKCLQGIKTPLSGANSKLGISMVQCTHFVSKLEVHIISKVLTHKISPILDSSKVYI
jgi:hypothetical protein